MSKETTKLANEAKIKENLKKGMSLSEAYKAAYPKGGAVKKASYNELTEEGMKITQDAFMDELHKIAGRGALFSKAIKTIKNVAGGAGKRAKSVASKVDKGVRNIGKKVGKGTRKMSKGKLKAGDLRTKKTQRLLGYGAMGGAALGAKGVKEAVTD